MSERIYVEVSPFCLVEAIRELDKQGAKNLGLSQLDNYWLLSFEKAVHKPDKYKNDDGSK